MTAFPQSIRQGRWARHPDIDWLQPGELQGDALTDLQTTGGVLSVFATDGGVDQRDIVMALAARRDNISNLDYVMFDDGGFATAELEAVHADGDTPVAEVNRVHYHLIHLTTERLAHLASIVGSGERGRVTGRQIEALLRQAVRESRLNTARMNPKGLIYLSAHAAWDGRSPRPGGSAPWV